MSDPSAVIPPPEERPKVIGSMVDFYGTELAFSVCKGILRLHIGNRILEQGTTADFDPGGCDEFVRLIFAAMAEAEATVPP